MDGAAAGGRDKRWPLGDYVRRLGPPRGECGGKNDLELRAPLAVARPNASCIKFASDMYMYTPRYAGVDTHDRVDQRAGLSSRRTASGPGQPQWQCAWKCVAMALPQWPRVLVQENQVASRVAGLATCPLSGDFEYRPNAPGWPLPLPTDQVSIQVPGMR